MTSYEYERTVPTIWVKELIKLYKFAGSYIDTTWWCFTVLMQNVYLMKK